MGLTNKILVTGANGTVSREVIRQLVAENILVRAGVHSLSRDNHIDPGVERVELDFTRPETFAPALRGIRKVFMLTPGRENIVELAGSFIDALKAARINRVVRLSVMGADTPAPGLLVRQHQQIEQLILASGIPHTFLRPNYFMQNFINSMSETIRTQGAFYGILGETPVSMIDVRDIARVAVKSLLQNTPASQVYTLTGGEALTYSRCAEILSQTLKTPVAYINLGDEVFRNNLIAAHLPAWYVAGFLELSISTRNGNNAAVSDDVEIATGVRPITFSQFVQAHAEAWQPVMAKAA